MATERAAKACVKKRFTSKAKAEAQIALAWRTGRGKKLPIRSYRCPFCGGWHTTSQPKRERPSED